MERPACRAPPGVPGLTARPAQYAKGDVLAYRHKGAAYVGTLVKCQRRAAVILNKNGNPLTVPWGAVHGLAPRKPKEHQP